MKHLGQIKQVLVTGVLICLGIRVVFWAIEPLLPYLLGGLCIVFVLALAIFRTTKF